MQLGDDQDAGNGDPWGGLSSPIITGLRGSGRGVGRGSGHGGHAEEEEEEEDEDFVVDFLMPRGRHRGGGSGSGLSRDESTLLHVPSSGEKGGRGGIYLYIWVVGWKKGRGTICLGYYHGQLFTPC